MRGKLLAALFMSMGVSATAQASWLLDFKPHPPTPVGVTKYEVSWDGSTLFETPASRADGGGAISTADPSIAGQVIGGLIIGTPLNIAGVPLSENVGGGTTFYDATLHIIPPSASGPADSQPAVGLIRQPLGLGGFEIWSSSSDPNDYTKGTLLLKGEFREATLVGITVPGLAVQSVQALNVMYTDGAIADLLPPGGLTGGSFSWSLGNLSDGGLHVGNNGFVAPFDADMTGVFESQLIPEPASLSLLGLAALGLIRRSRK